MVSRVYSLERFLQILIENKFYFISPVKWEDPWEAVPYREFYQGKSEMIVPIYGSCWTENPETDLAWRAYSKHGNGIMVFADEEEILKYFKEIIGGEFPESTVEGNLVTYLTAKEIDELNRGGIDFRYLPNPKDNKPMQVVFYTDQLDGINTGSLFLKRDFFFTEREFRFIIHLANELSMQLNDSYSIAFDPNRFFSEIKLDPNIKGNDFDFYKGLIQRLGFNKPILRSSIFEEPPATMNNNI